jgi:hypothetical protein
LASCAERDRITQQNNLARDFHFIEPATLRFREDRLAQHCQPLVSF